MNNHFNTVKEYLSELDLVITHEDEENEVFVIEDENAGT